MKRDFGIALNNLHKDTMLSPVAEQVSGIYKFCHLLYGKIPFLKFANSIILSQEGAQQGDPLDPFLFC